MGYVSQDQVAQAKEIDLLTYLQACEPQELVHVGGNTWCTREHDSLKISNGKWHWFSRGIGGKTALDYLIKVQGYTFPDAVETLTGRVAARPPIFHAPKPEPPREFLMPELNSNTAAVRRYLTGRGIHREIIDYCVGHRLLFETKQYHNAMFAGYDRNGKMRYAALRGTMGDFKGEVSGSDKHYSFAITAPEESGSLHLFESAIDAMSYATLCLMTGRDWQRDHLLSLAGVYKMKRETVVPLALSQYLQDHPDVRTMALHLDNDEIGRDAAAGIMNGLKGRYQVFDQPPRNGKDVNDALLMKLGRIRDAPER